jgi:hypothetical protein
MIISFQCHKCKPANLYLDETRSWLPLKGQTQLTFLDDNGNPAIFKLHVVDTTEIAIDPDCGTPVSYQYITTSLYLNPTMTDSIFFSLSSGGWLCMRAMTGNIPNISMCNVFGQTKEAINAKKLSDYLVGTRRYHELILLLHNPSLANNIDSIFLANNVGIVGLKYLNNHYSLQ